MTKKKEEIILNDIYRTNLPPKQGTYTVLNLLSDRVVAYDLLYLKTVTEVIVKDMMANISNGEDPCHLCDYRIFHSKKGQVQLKIGKLDRRIPTFGTAIWTDQTPFYIKYPAPKHKKGFVHVTIECETVEELKHHLEAILDEYGEYPEYLRVSDQRRMTVDFVPIPKTLRIVKP